MRLIDLKLALFNIFLLFKVTFAQEPSLTVTPESIRKNIGESVISGCIANVENPDLITNMQWTDPRGQLIPNIDESIVLLEDQSNQLSLYIKSLQEDNVGQYKCSATYAGNQKLEKTFKVGYYREIDFQDTEKLQTPILGTDAKIKCVVSSEPPARVDWLKNGVNLKNDERIITQPDGVLIKQIGEQDEGVYRCRARVMELGEIQFQDIQVEVYLPTEITSPPEDVSGVEKETASFACVARGKPAPLYTWLNKDSEVLNAKEGYFVDEETGVLRILDLRPDHAGTYRCIAKNEAGEDAAEATLRVLTKPRIERLLNVTVAEQTEAQLRCLVAGDPMPEVIFQKETNAEPFFTGVNNDHRIEVVQEVDDHNNRVGILTITDVSRADDGLYTCTGNSSGGLTVAWGHITVEFKPSFEDQPQNEFWTWEQKPVNLTCLATSIPNATIQWFLRELPIREDDRNLEVLSRGPNGVLQVHPVDGSYFDNYTCRATNTIGITSHSVVLRQVQKPGPVSATQVDKTTATTVSWTIRDPVNDGGLTVTGYTVQYRPADMAWDKAQERFWAKGSTYVIDKLTPLATYVFRFAARNDVGDGEWSGEKRVDMPQTSVPEEPLIFGVEQEVVKAIPYFNYYQLQWQVPLDNGEPIDYFEIVYYQVHNSSLRWKTVGPKKIEKVPYPGDTSYKIEELKSNSLYRIELRAHNGIGFSLPAEAVIKTAFDSSTPDEGSQGSRVPLSSVAPPTAANASVAPVGDSKDANVGLIVAIVVIVILILLVVIDVVLFFAKNFGLIALIVSKLGAKPSEKDKEAMIAEAAKQGSKPDDNSNKEVDKAALKEKECSETTPMINGETDKEAIKNEEKLKEVESGVANSAATNEALSKDSAV